MNKKHDPLEGISSAGKIVTGASFKKITSDFRPIVEEAVNLVDENTDGASLYLYGSVATGTAVVKHSDVDFVLIGNAPLVADYASEKLSNKFIDLCRGVELGFAQHSDYKLQSDEAYGNRAFLRHYCVHLTGKNLKEELPDFEADRAAARGFNGNIGTVAESWKINAFTTENPQLFARQLARKPYLQLLAL